MTKRNVVIVALVALLLVVAVVWAVGNLGGSNSEARDGVDSGVVIERSRRSVTVREDDGEKDRHSISKRSRKCQVGSRWPACKK